MPNSHSHVTFAAQYEYRTYFQLLYKAMDTNSAADFQGWPKMTLKITMAYFSIFRDGFQKKSLTAVYRTT